MSSFLQNISQTSDNKKARLTRLILGGMFVMTGLMKLVVPSLGTAFAGQLVAANIPFVEFNLWFVPIVETLVGLQLVMGKCSRLGALVVIGLMVVATYVHLVVDDPELFPLQPELPIIPIMVIAMSVYILVEGDGTDSLFKKAAK